VGGSEHNHEKLSANILSEEVERGFQGTEHYSKQRGRGFGRGGDAAARAAGKCVVEVEGSIRGDKIWLFE